MKALSHPIRMRALVALSEKVASPSDLARELDEPIGVLSYHVRQLLELDCVELVKTEQRRGATEHYYRATTRAIFDDGWERLPKEARTALSSGVLSDIWRDIGRALTAGSFDSSPERHLSWTNLVLDEESWKAVNERLVEVLEWALELQAEAAPRLADGNGSVVSKLVLMHYPAAASPDTDASGRQSPRGAAASSARGPSSGKRSSRSEGVRTG
jgi:DNA-binding transcriptional ArsR family regulator